MKILYAEDETDLLEQVSLYIEGQLNIGVHKVKNASQAIEYLETNLQNDNRVDLILSDFTMDGGNGDLIYEYLKKKSLDIPFILTSNNELIEEGAFQSFFRDNKKNHYVKKPFNIEKLAETVTLALNQTPSHTTNLIPHFCRVHLDRFLKVDHVQCDVHMQITNKKYIKILNKEDTNEKDVFQKYKKKGVEYLYINRAEFHQFSKKYMNMILKELSDVNKPVDEIITIQVEGHAFIHERIQSLGIDEETTKALDQIATSSMEVIKEVNKVSSLLKIIMKNGGFQYEHTLMTGYVSGAIAMNVNWGNPQNMRILMIASMIHDVALNSPILVEEHDKDDHILEVYKKNTKIQKLIKNHPIKGASLIKDATGLPNGVKQIVADHHERPDGNGYPQRISVERINPLTALFIIAEEFVSKVYGKNVEEFTEEQFEDLRLQFSDRYNVGNFKKPLAGLLNLIDNIQYEFGKIIHK